MLSRSLFFNSAKVICAFSVCLILVRHVSNHRSLSSCNQYFTGMLPHRAGSVAGNVGLICIGGVMVRSHLSAPAPRSLFESALFLARSGSKAEAAASSAMVFLFV
jgi:hypothetical protein